MAVILRQEVVALAEYFGWNAKSEAGLLGQKCDDEVEGRPAIATQGCCSLLW